MKNLLSKLRELSLDDSLSMHEKKLLGTFIAGITPQVGFLEEESRDHLTRKTDGIFSRKEFEEIFDSVDNDIEKKESHGNDLATNDALFSSHRIVKDATLRQIFNEAEMFTDQVNKLFFTKNQIKDIFVKSKQFFFSDRRSHFFFYKNDAGDCYSFNVYRSSGRWIIGLLDLDGTYTWSAEQKHVLFLLQ